MVTAVTAFTGSTNIACNPVGAPAVKLAQPWGVLYCQVSVLLRYY